MHAVSSGLIFLAHMHPADIDAFLASSLERYTPTTVVDPATIRERLRRAQLDGYVWARDEVADGISSVAAALADEDGEVVAAIHVHGPSYRFPADGAEEQLSEQVVSSAARISASLRQAG
jgi:DNA-binding IclR family transcriptional regulator